MITKMEGKANMKIRWLVDCIVNIVESPEFFLHSGEMLEEVKKAGTTDIVEIVGYGSKLLGEGLSAEWFECVDLPCLKFANGKVSMAVSREWFEEVK